MAELIATQEEKDAVTYFDWSDEALGKFTKYVGMLMNKHKDDADGLHRVMAASGAITLITSAHQSNAAELKINLDDHYIGKTVTGDWVVLVKRKDAPTDSDSVLIKALEKLRDLDSGDLCVVKIAEEALEKYNSGNFLD